jgi:ribosomal protein S9
VVQQQLCLQKNWNKLHLRSTVSGGGIRSMLSICREDVRAS